MGKYDLTMKRLTSGFPEDYACFVLKRERFAVEPLEVEETERELPSLSREVDFVARVTADGEQTLLLIEFQTSWKSDMPQRMVSYTWRLVERYKLGVYPVVVVLRPGGDLQNEWRMQALGKEIDWFRFDVIPIWEVDVREVIAQKLVGVYPLLPLMCWEDKSDAEILETSRRLVLEETLSREERADAYVALQVLSGIRYPLELVHELLRRDEIMLESPVYREFVEEGRIAGLKEGKELGWELGKELGLEEGKELGWELGKELGLEEGKELGLEEGLQESVLEALDVRFGIVPPEVELKVRQLRGRKSLEGIHRLSILTESMDAFQESLSRIQGS